MSKIFYCFSFKEKDEVYHFPAKSEHEVRTWLVNHYRIKDYDDPDEFINYYMGNQELLGGIQTLVMEDMVVDWITEQATVTAKSSTFDDVMNPEAATK